VAFRIGKEAELRAGNALRREDDSAAQLLRLGERGGDVMDVHEECDVSGSALCLTDAAWNGAIHAGHDKLVPRLGCVREGPVEELAVEVAGRIGVAGANSKCTTGLPSPPLGPVLPLSGR